MFTRTEIALEPKWLEELDLLAYLIDLLLDDRILSLRGVRDDLGNSPPHCVIFLIMLDCCTSSVYDLLDMLVRNMFTAGTCLETTVASCAFATCCVRLRIFDDLLHHFLCGHGHVDDLCNDSFRDSLPWNAVTNFQDSFGDLRNWYVLELLKTMCLVNVALKDRFISLLSSSVSFSMSFHD